MYLYLPILLILLFFSVFVTNKIIKLEITPVKYPEIDGIRGYLAFFVFLHHSCIWYVFLKTDKWEEPKSNLFNHFGQTSVTLFFIITAFLFITKIIETKTPDFDWNKYIKSRFFRMFPMYFISIAILFLIVLLESNFEQKDSILAILRSTISWVFFTIDGSKDINGVENTYIIDAGVSWTLPYEWMFYFLLPILALFYKLKVDLKTIFIFTATFLLIAKIYKPSLVGFFPFIGGIISAICIHKYNYREQFQKNIFSIIGVILLTASITFTHSGDKPMPILIATFVFILIASGNSFFGILSSAFSRKLGQITYSIYLIHGIILFVVFRYIIGFEQAIKLTEIEHWSIIILCVFPVVFISQLTFKYIELPFINFKKKK